MPSQRDKQIVRELAKQYIQIAQSEKQQRAHKRMLDTNDLKLVRPPVLLDEIPWYQLNAEGELTCLCEEKKAQEAELWLRKALYYNKHFNADAIIEPFFRVQRSYSSSGIGIDFQTADMKRTDDQNNIVSREFVDVMEDESVLELLRDPEFTLHPEKDEYNMNYLTDLFGDTMQVKLYGYGIFYHAPWDKITRLRGVEPILMDMYDRPEYLHAIMDKFVSAANAELDFIEKNLDVDPTFPKLHCTPGMISGREGTGLKATWYRSMAQSFGSISPKMFKEFEIDHITSLAERFAYTYYGCCEPLDDKIDVIKKISNLRKVGVSPWANVNSCAEQLRGDFVFARKPNPAHVAMRTDPDVIRRETEETVKACIKNGCPCEFVLKDISTVSHKPENLIVWAKTVSDVLDQYYDRA